MERDEVLRPLGEAERPQPTGERLLTESLMGSVAALSASFKQSAHSEEVATVRVALYERVSTTDKNQDPETQGVALRECVTAQDWTPAGEYVDHASANDLRGRTAWRRLLEDAARRRVDLILVWKLDRAFRSVAHMAHMVEQLRRWGVGLRFLLGALAGHVRNVACRGSDAQHPGLVRAVRAGSDCGACPGRHGAG